MVGSTPSLAAETPKVAPYPLPAGFSIVGIVPPAPQPGDARYEADRRIFRETRALAGSDRWRLAINDASERPEDMLRDFSGAAGLDLTTANAPRTTAFLLAAALVTAKVNDEAKATYQRKRPFLIDEGPICQPASEVINSYDYPSGHTTRAWTWATLLAELLPDHAAATLARGRAYGESRIVCGVHNASAVEAGRLSSASTLTAMEQGSRFQADFRAARAELMRLVRSSRTTARSRSPEEVFIPSIYQTGVRH
jgi:acid phosphatase (class A)